MSQKTTLLGIAFVLLFHMASGQQVVVLNEGFPLFDGFNLVQEHIHVLEDHDNLLTIDDVASAPWRDKFVGIPTNSPNFGYATHTFWLRIRVENRWNLRNSLFYLDIAYPTLDSVWLYQQEPTGQWARTLTGDLVPLSKRPVAHRHLVLPMHLPAHTSTTLYIKVRSTGSILIPLWVQTTESLRLSQVKDESFYFFFYGVVWVMIFYNLFLYFTLRDRNYLLYCVTIFLNLLAQANLLGHTLYFWGNTLWWVNIAITVTIFTYMAVLLIFAAFFLQIRKYSKKLYSVFVGASVVCFVLAILSFGIDYTITVRISALVVLLTSLFVIVTGTYAWKKGRTSARFFVLAWTLYLIGAMSMALRNAGFIADSFFARHGAAIGTMLEVVLISLALADRINLYRRQKEEAQEKMLSLAQEQNELLEERVQERTHALQTKQEEILAQNEELRQTQEELQTQRDAIVQKNKELEFRSTQIKHSIMAAKHIQDALLPSPESLQQVFDDYFIFFRPRDIVSGDFYWLKQVGSAVWLVAADCTGHGVPGAFMNLLSKNILDNLVLDKGVGTPAELLEQLDVQIQQAMRTHEGGRLHQGLDLVVLKFEGETSAGNMRVLFGGAKNRLYVLRPQSKTLEEYQGDRILVGGFFRRDRYFRNEVLEVPKGTRLFLGTDGYQDQNDFARNSIGSLRFKAFLEQIAPRPLAEQKQALADYLKDHMEGTEQRDDILWMGIQL